MNVNSYPVFLVLPAACVSTKNAGNVSAGIIRRMCADPMCGAVLHHTSISLKTDKIS